MDEWVCVFLLFIIDWCLLLPLGTKDPRGMINGEIIVRSKELNAKPFKQLSSDKLLGNGSEFMTMDIETINIDGKMSAYLICGYNPSHFISSRIEHLSEINDRFRLVNDFMTQLYNIPKVKYVYAHNLSNFDGVFLLKYLLKIRYSSLRR